MFALRRYIDGASAAARKIILVHCSYSPVSPNRSRLQVYFMNIYVGNLPYSSGDTDVRTLFERFGAVDSASVITDKFTGKSRGFAFVEMPDDGAAKEAIEGLNGEELDGRNIVVREARPRQERGGGGGGGNRGPRRFNDR